MRAAAFPPADRRAWLARAVGAAGLALVGATGPLWLPPAPDRFPQLPLVSWLINAPAWCDLAALAGILAGAAGMLLTPRDPREPEARARWATLKPRLRVGLVKVSAVAPALLAVSLAGAMLLNQIRVQVWAYQFLLLAGVLALCPRTGPGDRAAVALARALAVGILFHSALSKLDLAFAEGPGSWLMGGFLGLFGADAGALDGRLVAAAAFAVPAWELALAVLLAVPGLRRAGLAGAVLMHAALVATLWKLNQSWGVLLWNAFFLAHAFVLFRPDPPRDRVPSRGALRAAGPRAWAAGAIVLAAVTLPFGTRAGYWDVWPGWAVYAGGVPRGRVTYLEREYTPGPGLRLLLGGQQAPTDWEGEALAELGAPLPQDARVAVGVLLAKSARFAEPGERTAGGTVSIEASASLLGRRPYPPGKPRVEVEDGRVGWPEQSGGLFLLNARPRALSLPPRAR